MDILFYRESWPMLEGPDSAECMDATEIAAETLQSFRIPGIRCAPASAWVDREAKAAMAMQRGAVRLDKRGYGRNLKIG